MIQSDSLRRYLSGAELYPEIDLGILDAAQ
jgi:hypothetical protein